MPDEKKDEQFTEGEEIVVPLTPPLDQPSGEPLSTETLIPIKRYGPNAPAPLSETHGQTTEANRFKET